VRFLVTGAAGFIGSHLSTALASSGHQVVAVDNMSNYYSVGLKEARKRELIKLRNINFEILDLTSRKQVEDLFLNSKFDSVFHLAAQPGVRLPRNEYSSYINNNLVAYENVFTRTIEHSVVNFLYASSSSVYGNLKDTKYSEIGPRLAPVSFYGVTKLANELMAPSLIQGSDTKARGLRFFTVYGPWGRPDMAYFRIISNALTGSPFSVYGDGNVTRDFTYVGDVVQSIVGLDSELRKQKSGFSDVVNIGGGKPCSLNQMITEINQQLGVSNQYENQPFNSNDVLNTNADTSYLYHLIGSRPEVSLAEGMKEVIKWAVDPIIRDSLFDWASSVG